MMLVFRALTMSLAAMGNVTVVLCLNFIIFGIMGVNLFGGRFYSCNDTTVPNKVKVLALSCVCSAAITTSSWGTCSGFRLLALAMKCIAHSFLSAVSARCGWCLPLFP